MQTAWRMRQVEEPKTTKNNQKQPKTTKNNHKRTKTTKATKLLQFQNHAPYDNFGVTWTKPTLGNLSVAD
jgi:hypothetical protein